MTRTSLVVIGAGPYGVAVAAHAQARGIDTTVVGRPMEFWTRHMPERMCLRSGLDWHLDATGEHTFSAFAEEHGISASDVDPVPIAVFLAYAAWFQERAHVDVTETLVTTVRRSGDGFDVTLEDGTCISAARVVAAPGARYFRRLPEWAGAVPTRGAHSVDLARFDDLAGARVLVVGGRQSAYEWAALAGEHGAQRVDVVHRHAAPRFARVSWAFVDPYMEETVSVPGWWRRRPVAERQAIDRRFWEAGRLTLEWWLAPRLAAAPAHRWPETHVAGARERSDGSVEVTGLASTRDFGPFFGFTKGCPSAARLVVDGLLRAGSG